MKFEHAALNVTDPVAAAEWYVTHLGMKIVRQFGPPNHTRFLADRTGRVILEVFINEAAPTGTYADTDPLVLHFAFAVDDIEAERARLLGAGASAAGEIADIPNGDRVVMLRDPWGLPVQLVTRAESMV